MSNITNNLTSGFVDLATYDEMEKYMYGGASAFTYFVKQMRKATWFTVVPCVLNRIGGSTFGSQYSVTISRAGDYMIRSWMRVQLPAIDLSAYKDSIYPLFGSQNPNASGTVWGPNDVSIRYTRNFMHNLIKECSLTFNDLVESRFDNWFLDFWAAFTVPAGKRNGYQNMIGNFEELTNPIVIGQLPMILPSVVLNLPLPFTHFRESGLSLPTAALPYNEMRINVATRNLNELLIIDNHKLGTSIPCPPNILTQASVSQQLTADIWAEYALVSNMERAQMGKAPRDMLIEQVQTAPIQQFQSNFGTNTTVNLHFAHAIKALYFAVQNVTNPSEWSNYTCGSPVPSALGVTFSPTMSTDPIATTSLYYENTQRLANIGSDYFSLIQPWYTAIDIPLETGYHLYSYSLDLVNFHPLGSTNYGKLTNVSLACSPSADATIAGNAPGSGSTVNNPSVFGAQGAPVNQIYNIVVVGQNHNIIRIAGGALGFPVL